MITEKVFSGLRQNTVSGSSPWEAVREETELRGYSVLRGFTPPELASIVPEEEGWLWSIRRSWAFRICLIGKRDGTGT